MINTEEIAVNKPNKPEIFDNKQNKTEIEFLRLKDLFSDGGKEFHVIEPLIQNAAFMRVTLDDLQDLIAKDGVVDTYMNGANQYGTKQSAALQSYNSLIGKYAAVIKTLAQYLPPERRASLYDMSAYRKPELTEEEKAEERKRIEADHEELVRKLNELRASLNNKERTDTDDN